MEKHSRAALGQVAALGDLYDARTDNFLNISIFNQKIPESAMSIMDNQFTDLQIIHTDSYSEKFSQLGVKAELQVKSLVKVSYKATFLASKMGRVNASILEFQQFIKLLNI